MKDFMSYLLESFTRASGEILDFQTPRGLRLTLSSLATPNFATSYQLGTVGVVDGSITYLYSSIPLADADTTVQSDRIPLKKVLRSWRVLSELGEQNPLVVAAEEARLERAKQPRWDPKSLLEYWRTLRPGVGVETGEVLKTEKEVVVVDKALIEQPAQQNIQILPPQSTRKEHNMMYGRLYLPQSLLEILIARRPSPNLQVQMVAVSQSKLRSGGTLLGSVQYDVGRYGMEGLVSTDGGLLGLRGVYNFGGDASPLTFPSLTSDGFATIEKNPEDVSMEASPTASEAVETQTLVQKASTSNTVTSTTSSIAEKDRIYGRFTAGGEFYYGTLNKSGGMSFAGRFQTLPDHQGTPLTATLTINPLMGNISASYAVAARKGYRCSLATRMAFNVYSYESEWAIGMELWNRRRPMPPPRLSAPIKTYPERSFQAKMEWRLDEPVASAAADVLSTTRVSSDKSILGVLKARLDQNLDIGLLWEGRYQAMLFSVGSGIDLRRLDSPFRSLGLELQYSS